MMATEKIPGRVHYSPWLAELTAKQIENVNVLVNIEKYGAVQDAFVLFGKYTIDQNMGIEDAITRILKESA